MATSGFSGDIRTAPSETSNQPLTFKTSPSSQIFQKHVGIDAKKEDVVSRKIRQPKALLKHPKWKRIVEARIPSHLPAVAAYRQSSQEYPPAKMSKPRKVKKLRKTRAVEIEEFTPIPVVETVHKEESKEELTLVPPSPISSPQSKIAEDESKSLDLQSPKLKGPWTPELRQICAEVVATYMRNVDLITKDTLKELKKFLQHTFPTLPLEECNAAIYVFADHLRTSIPTESTILYAMRDEGKFKKSKHETRLSSINDALSYIASREDWVSINLLHFLESQHAEVALTELKALVTYLRNHSSADSSELLEAMQRAESRLVGSPLAKDFDRYESLNAAIRYIKNTPSWDELSLRRLFESEFPDLKIEDREARIRIFKDVRKGLVPLDSIIIESLLHSEKYHWGYKTREQCIQQALAWTLSHLSGPPAKWEPLELNTYITKQFPDLPEKEKSHLINLISQGITQGVIKPPRNRSWYQFGKSKPARVKPTLGWTIPDLILSLEKAGNKRD